MKSIKLILFVLILSMAIYLLRYFRHLNPDFIFFIITFLVFIQFKKISDTTVPK